MDWFHCNKCFKQRGSSFAVTSCGHICCDECFTPNKCTVCGASCYYLTINEEMKPQEKVFFREMLKLMQKGMEQITQIAVFQQKQMEKIIVHFRNKSVEQERRLNELIEGHRQRLAELRRENSDLKRENAELNKPLSQRRASPGLRIDGGQRMTLPVAVTSPVTPSLTPLSRPLSRFGSAESHGRTGDRRRSLSTHTTPGSISSLFSSSSLLGSVQRTPMPLNNATRPSQQQNPTFQFQLPSGFSN